MAVVTSVRALRFYPVCHPKHCWIPLEVWGSSSVLILHDDFLALWEVFNLWVLWSPLVLLLTQNRWYCQREQKRSSGPENVSLDMMFSPPRTCLIDGTLQLKPLEKKWILYNWLFPRIESRGSKEEGGTLQGFDAK